MIRNVILILCLCATVLEAHDTWLQTSVSIVRPGDVLVVDLMLGNHGNDHRDFKLAGKVGLAGSNIDPDGQSSDLKPDFVDVGYTAKDGYWETTVSPGKAGLYLLAQSADSIASYAPERIIRSAKSFFIASKSLDKAPADLKGYDRVLGHALEIVPQTNPVCPMGPGTTIRVKLLYHGKPLANERVSFIPRGQTLKPDFDPAYDRKTDKDGLASFEVSQAGRYLIAAHHEEADEKGDGYTRTKYGATMTLLVPAICPCCGE